jgi:GNAT superfamily N-acetyltransferase
LYLKVQREAVLTAIAIDPERRRRGLGTALLASIEREAALGGATNMNLSPIDDDARAFFEENGYRPHPELIGQPEEGRLLVKPLDMPMPE